MSSDDENYSSEFDEESSTSDDYDSEIDDDVRNSEAGGSGMISGLESSLPTIEGRIEGDFDRLVQNIRIGDVDTNSSLLTKDWDINADEQETAFREDLRAASGVGRKRGGKKGRKVGVQLSHQVKALIGEGNQAYIDNDVPRAMRTMQEVIRIEPRAAAPWSVLANCYSDLGQPDKALQVRIMAAHLHHDAEEWEHLARESRDKGFNRQSLYCLSKACSLDADNINAFWDRAFLAKELGEHRVARTSLLAILKRRPHDLTVLEEIRPILIEINDIKLCAELFDKAYQHYAQQHPAGYMIDAVTGAVLPGGGFGLMELLALADMYNSLGEHDRAVHIIRSGVRWLQGRQEQRLWDSCEDDREYDVGMWRLVGQGSGELAPGQFPLDVNARHRLAIARIRMREFEEGGMHARIVLEQDVIHYAPLFHEIGDAYFEREMYAEAKPIYEVLGHDAGTSSLDILVHVARCHHMLGELEEAAEVYETVIAADASANDPKMRLAEIYEILNEPRKALDLVYQVIDSRRRKPRENSEKNTSEDNHSMSLFEESGRTSKKAGLKSQNRLTPAQLQKLEQQRETETTEGYKRILQLWPSMTLPDGTEGQAEAEREWLLEAEKLVEMFRSTRNLFTTSKLGFRGMISTRPARRKPAQEEEEDMASRLHLNLEHDRIVQRARKTSGRDEVKIFRGVHFDDWLRLIIQYAFLLAKRDHYELAEETLSHMLCSLIVKGEKVDTVRIAIIACAAYAKRYNAVVEQSRKIISTHQFNNEPARLLLASLASGFRATDVFISSNLQKFLLREMRLGEMAVHSPEKLRYNPVGRRWVLVDKGGKSKDDAPEDEGQDIDTGDAGKTDAPTLPIKDNPVLAAIYGQISLDVKSYQSALYYLLTAYEYFSDDPVICLSIAIGSLGRAMQRQADNRHHLIAQGMAFLTRYRELRDVDPVTQEEVEFNFGRAFQQLGLHSHAVKHYERVLKLAEKRTQDHTQDPGLAKETAYNLSLIYVTTGAAPLAEALYRRWLSI